MNLDVCQNISLWINTSGIIISPIREVGTRIFSKIIGETNEYFIIYMVKNWPNYHKVGLSYSAECRKYNLDHNRYNQDDKMFFIEKKQLMKLYCK